MCRRVLRVSWCTSDAFRPFLRRQSSASGGSPGGLPRPVGHRFLELGTAGRIVRDSAGDRSQELARGVEIALATAGNRTALSPLGVMQADEVQHRAIGDLGRSRRMVGMFEPDIMPRPGFERAIARRPRQARTHHSTRLRMRVHEAKADNDMPLFAGQQVAK